MSMTKQERKESYVEIQQAMMDGNNKKAFQLLASMCGKDTGLYFLSDYDSVVEMRESLIEQA